MNPRRPAQRTSASAPQGRRAPASRKAEPGTPKPKKRSPGKPPAASSRGTAHPGPAESRAPGRPAAAGPELRVRLLDAALACFVRSGIAATSLRAIAGEAGVTPALVHYYFGDKVQLTEAVVEERVLPALAPLRTRIEQAVDEPAALIAGYVRGMGEMIAAHPWVPALWVREVLCEGGALRQALFERLIPQLPQLLAARFAAAQAAGRLNPDLDPRLLVVSLAGLTLFPAAGAPIWRRMFEADDLDAEALAGHTIALLDRGVEAG